MKRFTRAVLASALGVAYLAPAAVAQTPDTATRVTFGAFVDGYFAYDFGRPPTLDRAYTTQPARHDEFNVNLAFVEANVAGPRVHGRLAAQWGTSVQANYFGEPRVGSYSGPGVQQFIQEAYAGVKLGEALWVDGGIFYANMGMEGWVSRDNPTYTRSLVADYSPYYSSGVRAVWQATPALAVRLDVVNGWQNISETNTDKSAGLRLDYVAGGTTLSYYDFFGNHAASSRLRAFNGVGAKSVFGAVTLLGEFDFGSEQKAGADGSSRWYGYTAVARIQIAPAVGVSGRVERFDDRDGVVLATGLTGAAGAYLPFRANGFSAGLDLTPAPGVLWRSEVRGYEGGHAIFPDRGGLKRSDALVVTSLALTF